MSQSTEIVQDKVEEDHIAEARQEPSFHYRMFDLKGRKIATLIKFAKLPYQIVEVIETESKVYYLRTSQGQLYDQYEIMNYVLNDNFLRNARTSSHTENSEDRSSLCVDIFTWAKMSEHLYQLRKTLFPMLQQFYRYLLGHQRVKRSKYESLGNKIRKEILRLDQTMGEHSQIYGVDYCFLNIVIVCELFMACKFYFQEKFRKSKIRLFSKCEKIWKTTEFEEIYGKASFCVRQCLPVDFQDQDQPETKKEEVIQIELAKLVEPWVSPSGNQMRNELLYNFFRNTFKGQESKNTYFPYFWLMYDNLLCTLVELHYNPIEHGDAYPDLEKSLLVGVQQLSKIMKTNEDYGFLGIYFNQKDRQYILQGLVCLGEHSFEQFSEELAKQTNLKRFKPVKVDIHSQQQRKKIEMLWEYQTEGMTFEGVKVSLIRQF